MTHGKTDDSNDLNTQVELKRWKMIHNTDTMTYKKTYDSNVQKGRIQKYKKVKLATLVEGNSKAPFSIATTPRRREERYSIPRIAPLYPWSLSYSAEF